MRALGIHYISRHFFWHPTMPQEKKNETPNKWLPWSHQTASSTMKNGRSFSVQQQPSARLSGNAPFFFPLECVCAECVAPVVAINPNLTDTGSKSTFREPWKLTGEDSLPSPRLTSKTRQQWRVQWKTSTFRKNKETWRERERRRAGLRLETRHGQEAEYQKGMNTKKASICPMHILENSDWM